MTETDEEDDKSPKTQHILKVHTGTGRPWGSAYTDMWSRKQKADAFTREFDMSQIIFKEVDNIWLHASITLGQTVIEVSLHAELYICLHVSETNKKMTMKQSVSENDAAKWVYFIPPTLTFFLMLKTT